MVKIEKTRGRMILLLAGAFFLLGIAGGGLLQNSTTFAASSANVGYVDFQLLVSQHPDMIPAQQAMQAAADQAKQDFDAKSAAMSEQEKKDYYNQLQQQLAAKQQELLEPIKSKVMAAVKDVADAKGMTLVVDKSAAIYGGQDITGEVGKKITGQ
ncbi:MAG: OmpH family outer membrane protein [Negativicutes bacterium]|nr:OmpH family outer membrane protein [Negativicutes bacterium]